MNISIDQLGGFADTAIKNQYILDEVKKLNTLELRHYIRKHHCNIINFFPIELAKIALSSSFDPVDLDYPLQVFYQGYLYNLNDIYSKDLEKLISETIYVTTIKTMAKDYLDAWISHTGEGL